MEPENRDDEQVAVRHADASGGYIMENQHEEERMRDIQVSKRGSEAASEEQTEEWRNTERCEQEAPNASASSDPYVALEYPTSGETPCRPRSVLVQKSGQDAFYEKHGRKSRYIGEVLERYRGEVAGDLKTSASNELVENWTCVNVLERKIWKINPKILMDEKSWKTWKKVTRRS